MAALAVPGQRRVVATLAVPVECRGNSCSASGVKCLATLAVPLKCHVWHSYSAKDMSRMDMNHAYTHIFKDIMHK